MTLLDPPPSTDHSLIEDIIGLIAGTALMALTVQLLQAGGLFTGQIAGLSLVLSYAGLGSFAVIFFLLNLPFYWLAMTRMGARFTLKTFAAVALVSIQVSLLPRVLDIAYLHPLAAAGLAGITGGSGLLILFRHGATLGGIGIVAVYLQDTRGIKAGHVQLAFDAGIFALALVLFDWPVVAASALGAAIVNLVITLNHRRDRYIAR
jgi:uncharacterized membrane-anchored protein YitT (DUF2179 family)